MAANLALSDATVTLPDGTVLLHAHVLARDGVLRVRTEGHPDISVGDVASVERAGRDSWSVTTGAGVYGAVTKGCGCG